MRGVNGTEYVSILFAVLAKSDEVLLLGCLSYNIVIKTSIGTTV